MQIVILEAAWATIKFSFFVSTHHHFYWSRPTYSSIASSPPEEHFLFSGFSHWESVTEYPLLWAKLCTLRNTIKYNRLQYKTMNMRYKEYLLWILFVDSSFNGPYTYTYVCVIRALFAQRWTSRSQWSSQFVGKTFSLALSSAFSSFRIIIYNQHGICEISYSLGLNWAKHYDYNH